MGAVLRNLRTALVSLGEHKQRAVLSALGITVGSTAIVLLISIALGIRSDVSRQVQDLGVNLLFVFPARISGDSMFSPGLMGISHLRDQDVDRIRRVPGVVRAAPMSFIGLGLPKGKTETEGVFVVAAGADWFRMRPWELQEGRLLTPDDDLATVCVAGSQAAEKLFGKGPALGKTVVTGGKAFRVVGVTRDSEASASPFSQGMQNLVYVPYGAMKRQMGELPINRILVQTEPDRDPKQLVESIDAVLGERLGKDDYSVMTSQDLLKMIYKLMGILTWLLTGLTSIGLFIGGMGIMTVMLMAVNERSKEIGVRMTVGARRSDVFFQFLWEAAILALGGGAVGLALSYGVDEALRTWTPLKPLITPQLCGLTLAVCLAVGVVFGLLPAMKASRRQPVEAMRNEAG